MFGQASQPRGRRARGDRAGGGLGWFGQGSAGVSAGSNLMNEAFNSMAFYAPRISTITQTRGAGTPTETRATVATATNNDGFLVTALSGELREEGARRVRNLVATTSEDLSNAAWTKGSVTISAGKVVEVAASALHRVFESLTGIAGNTYVWSVHGTAAEREWIYIDAATSTNKRAWFNLTTGTVGTVDSGLSNPTIELQADGSYRCSVTRTITTTELYIIAGLADADNSHTYLGDSSKGAYLTKFQIEDVTAQTTQTAGEYVSVGVESAPYHGAGVDGVKYFGADISGNPIPAATLDGSLVEAAGTQILATADIRDMTTANWTLGATMTRARTSVGADGAANSATRLTGGAVAATNTCYTTITAAASSRTYSALVKRVTGTGPVRIVQTGTETDISAQLNASGYALVQLNASVLNVAVGFKIDTNLDAIDVDFNQFEAGAYATSRMAATGAARNADVLDDQVSSNLTGPAGTVAFTWTPSHDPSGTIALCGSYEDANNSTQLLHDGTKYIFRKRSVASNYDAELTAAFVSGTPVKVAIRWGANGTQIAVDGVLGTANANAVAARLGTRWQWGADGNGGQQAGAAFKEMYLTPRAMSDAELQAVTA